MSVNRISTPKGFDFHPLSEQHIDTGMGLERIVSVLQGKSSNYDTDIFEPYFQYIEQHWNVRKYTGKVGCEDVDSVDTSYRVVSDHVRTLVFGMLDGGCIGHKGRDYILKMLHRRGCLYSHLHLGHGSPSELVQLVVEGLHRVYPQLQEQCNVDDVLRQLTVDEQQFVKTMERGKSQLRKLVNKCLKLPPPYTLSGQDIYLLHTSFGFNVELVRITLEEEYHKKGVYVGIDWDGFKSCVQTLCTSGG